MYSSETETYEEGRDAALLSLDEEAIRSYFAAWNGGVDEFPRRKSEFWKQIHQAITAVNSLPADFRLSSKRWLLNRGHRSLDNGQV